MAEGAKRTIHARTTELAMHSRMTEERPLAGKALLAPAVVMMAAAEPLRSAPALPMVSMVAVVALVMAAPAFALVPMMSVVAVVSVVTLVVAAPALALVSMMTMVSMVSMMALVVAAPALSVVSTVAVVSMVAMMALVVPGIGLAMLPVFRVFAMLSVMAFNALVVPTLVLLGTGLPILAIPTLMAAESGLAMVALMGLHFARFSLMPVSMPSGGRGPGRFVFAGPDFCRVRPVFAEDEAGRGDAKSHAQAHQQDANQPTSRHTRNSFVWARPAVLAAARSFGAAASDSALLTNLHDHAWRRQVIIHVG
jgi:hypothetical protein